MELLVAAAKDALPLMSDMSVLPAAADAEGDMMNPSPDQAAAGVPSDEHDVSPLAAAEEEPESIAIVPRLPEPSTGCDAEPSAEACHEAVPSSALLVEYLQLVESATAELDRTDAAGAFAQLAADPPTETEEDKGNKAKLGAE